MTNEPGIHRWTQREKWLYALSMIPFVVVFLGTAYLLSTFSVYLAVGLVALYLVTNVFQAGCCVGCPYRGRYCPALCGVYLGNLLSGVLYRDRQFDPTFFARNAAGGEIMLLLTVLYPVYWIARTSWWLIPVYVVLLAAHVLVFMPTQCEKCSFNETCPGGTWWRRCRGREVGV